MAHLEGPPGGLMLDVGEGGVSSGSLARLTNPWVLTSPSPPALRESIQVGFRLERKHRRREGSQRQTCAWKMVDWDLSEVGWRDQESCN
ncbi:hypothetical protein B296_00043761 [Ensete ventricosum]|uniref:Uncharacterized protein n=1 Tax=Ensete ventricosum TaxID=4639 RepID=A0A426Y961_ENSVE|nr:hypothetical protein B296_00043761 [Ensete ventricosum]